MTAATAPLVAEDQTIFREYLALFHYKNDRRLVLDRQIAALATHPTLAPAVGRLQCFRGIQVHTAMVLATEIGEGPPATDALLDHLADLLDRWRRRS